MNGFGIYNKLSKNIGGDGDKIISANTLIDSGFYMSNKFSDVPYNNDNFTWWHIHVIQHNADYTVQVAYQFTDKNCPVYIRTQTYGIWNSWRNFNPGTATAAQVLKGYTFSSAAGSNLTGTYDPGDQYNSGYNAGYGSGRSQGQSDVTSNPNGYGLYTKSQYDTNWNNGYNSGVSAKTSNSWTGHVTITSNGSVNIGFQPNVILIKRDGDNFPIGVYCSYGISVNHIEGPSNSHLPNIFSTNGNGFSFGTLNSYTNNKYCYCAAFRIV